MKLQMKCRDHTPIELLYLGLLRTPTQGGTITFFSNFPVEGLLQLSMLMATHANYLRTDMSFVKASIS
jgi:hypothetical protein